MIDIDDDGPAQLDVAALKLDDSRQVALALIIAEETEAEREHQRLRVPDVPGKKPSKNRLAVLLDPDSYGYSYADTLQWETLLSLGTTVARAAKRANLSRYELVNFAGEHCQPRPSQVWALFWMGQYERIAQELAHARAKVNSQEEINRLIESKQERIREGARAGGKKSGATRQGNSRIPPLPQLQQARLALIANGTPELRANAALAKQYFVTPAAIRARLKRK